MAWRRLDRSVWVGLIVAAATMLFAAAPAAAETGSPVGDLGQAITALAIFALLAVILGKWAWRPVIGQLRRREQEIGETIRDAERRRKEAGELQTDYRARMDRAENEAKQYLAKELEQANQRRQEMLAAARGEGRKAIETAEAEIQALKQGALRDLQQTTAELAVSIAGEIVRKEIDAEQHQRLIEESLERICSRLEKKS